MAEVMKFLYGTARWAWGGYCTYRRTLFTRHQRHRLRNSDISIIASNCNGGVVASDFGMRFNSPFVNLFIKADDFIKLCGDLRSYLDARLIFVCETDPVYGDVDWPVAYLKDVKIHFMHYKTEQEARDCWERRVKRVNYDNIFIMFTDRSYCTQSDLENFDNLPYEHKVVFTHIPHPEIHSAFYIKGYENEEKVGILSEMQKGGFSWRRQMDQFDFVRWFNTGERKRLYFG